MTVTRAFLRKELTLFRNNPSLVIFLFLIPVLLTALLSHPFAALSEGHGADQTVPGFTLMFGFYVVMFMASAHYREHGWGSWTLVRVSGLSRPRMAFEIALPYFLLSATQLLVMVIAGHWVFGSHLNGSLVGLLLLVLATAASSIAIALLLVSLTSNLTVMQNVCNLLVLAMGAFAGALVPLQTMPGWSQSFARATPTYWALEGMKGVLSQRQGLADVLPNVGVLALFAAVVFALAVARFDPAKSRRLPLR